MNGVAKLNAAERAELFQETANRRGIATQIIEKDFWVCWTLRHLFELPKVGPNLIFKGGTSLSKVFQAIERFSEDIDVSINREYLGFEGDEDPENAESGNARKRRLEALQRACVDKVADEVRPSLNESFERVLGVSGDEKEGSSPWSLAIDDTDPQNLLFAYPRSVPSTSVREISYIRPIVKIEMGARSDHWPADKYPITPYAAEEFPGYFEEPTYTLKVLEAERTFWEKATLLHAEYYRPEGSTTADRISRHYYDLHRLALLPIGEMAMERLDLLDRVVEHKKTFFQLARANYDEARGGNIHLLPHEARLAALRVDYEKMRDMFFGEIPSFDSILDSLGKLEVAINARVSSRTPPKD